MKDLFLFISTVYLFCQAQCRLTPESIGNALYQIRFVAGGVAANGRALGGRLDKDLAPLGQRGLRFGQRSVILLGQEQVWGVGNADGGEPQLGADLVEADLARLGIATEIRQSGQLEEGLQIAGLTRVAVDAGHHVIHRTGYAVKRKQLVEPQLALAAIGTEPAIGEHLDAGHFDTGQKAQLLLEEIGAATECHPYRDIRSQTKLPHWVISPQAAQASKILYLPVHRKSKPNPYIMHVLPAP